MRLSRKEESGESKRKQRLLLKEGLKHLKPLKYKEFKCPICGGMASVSCFNSVVAAECHACGLRAWKG